jgi:hypothetical protein
MAGGSHIPHPEAPRIRLDDLERCDTGSHPRSTDGGVS